jgi:hypothetical protein
MQIREVIQVAKEIIKFGVKRDLLWERLFQQAGKRALEVLRHCHNVK